MPSLTVEQFRQHASSALSDDALQLLLNAAWEEIVGYAGAEGARTEYLDGGSRFITTHQPIDTDETVTITETRGSSVTTLIAGDYLVRSAMVIERLRTGTHPRYEFRGRVAIAYTPLGDTATRQSVQIDLVKLMETFSPGVTEETIGSWSQKLAANSAWNNSAERAQILARLNPHGSGMRVIG